MENKTSTQMATVYGLKSSVSFNKLLTKCGVLVDTTNGYVLAEALRGRGLSVVVEVPYFLPNGVQARKKKSVWTLKGQEYIRQRLGRIGIVPASEERELFGGDKNATEVQGTVN